MNLQNSTTIKFTQLEDIETCLRKIRAIGDWMTFTDPDSGFGFPEESLKETGFMLKDLVKEAIEVMRLRPAEEAPAGGE